MLVTLGFAIAQLGRAGDRKTQTQTAADAGASAAAKALAADSLLVRLPLLLDIPGTLGLLVDITGSYAAPSTAAYSAAERAWSVNRPPRQLNRGDVVTERIGIGTVRVTVTAPAGVIVDGPVAGASGTRPVATATATLSLRCEPVRSILNGVLNQLRRQLGLSGPVCREPLPTTTTTVASPTPTRPPALLPPLPPLEIPLADVLGLVRAQLIS